MKEKTRKQKFCEAHSSYAYVQYVSYCCCMLVLVMVGMLDGVGGGGLWRRDGHARQCCTPPD